MFPRLTRVRRSPSKVDEYLQLVESCRDDHGRTRQRVVVSLGRKDQLSAQLDALVRLLDRPRRWVDSERLAAPAAGSIPSGLPPPIKPLAEG